MGQQFSKLRCASMGDCWYLFAPYETNSDSSILLLIMIPLVDVVCTLMGGMILNWTHGLNVSLRGGDSHILCITCYNGNMRGYMATTTTQLLSCEVGHEFDVDIHSLYAYGHVIDLVGRINLSCRQDRSS